MANRLSEATSPYLLQHADNPVAWWPWCDEAFAEARERGVPVFLSVGYAACHWCHVMAHESFEDTETAQLINDHFVAIKVDREERPDVDAVYMNATQALTGQGGWPMTVFLTPDGKPFYAGTYFPVQPHHGLPSFRQVLAAITEAWRDRHDEIVGSADQIVTRLAEASPTLAAGALAADDLARARDELARSFDPIHAGFGTAPKFPPSMVLEALLRMGDDDALLMAGQTLEAMARGGIYDQLAGGFARYSVDAAWVVPHFEKMLYDNALLLGVYTHWWRREDQPLAARVVEETVGWLLREMRTEGGGFAASLDADSLNDHGDHREGAFYAWNRDQLTEALGAEDGAWAADVFAVTEAGTFEEGLSTLQLPGDVDAERLARVRERLSARREQRSRPARDDKVVAAWNGWLIDSLVQAAQTFDRPAWLVAATDAATLIWETHWVDGRLRRTSRDGVVGTAPGILEDYAAMAQAFVRLAAAHAEPLWLDRARDLFAVIEEQFGAEGGGFYDTAADAEALYSRPQDPTDNASPSGLSSAVHALELMAALTGEEQYAVRASAAAATGVALVTGAPRFAGWLWADAVSRTGSRSPVQVAIAGDPADPATRELVLTAHRRAPAGSIIVGARPDVEGLALLADRPMINNAPTAYVCRHFVCRLPVTDPAELAVQLAGEKVGGDDQPAR